MSAKTRWLVPAVMLNPTAEVPVAFSTRTRGVPTT